MVTIVTWLNTIATIRYVLKFDAATTQGQQLLEGSIELKLAPVCSTIQYAQLGIMLTAYNNEKISSHLVYTLIMFVNLALIK